ncbi:uncharacterized protein LOC131928617 isoform X2 [Physella acuta]|uniref:uncharacterized protein LOC131928617 isoform X2 n=1 Tax=Physella acuta TaxID=109671 RepID=UPI0027DCD0FE|nr:uncharacterized protein LOC131928617 isoform X2 [Physella acuta]
MPVTVVPVVPLDLNRAPPKPFPRLRYGNFEIFNHLPPLHKSFTSGEDHSSRVVNEQIFQTVCQWMDTWQPWQQKNFLYGVANRCNVAQLEIFSTTFEPLRHRDYKSVISHGYPLSSLMEKKLVTKSHGVKKKSHSKRKVSNTAHTPNKLVRLAPVVSATLVRPTPVISITPAQHKPKVNEETDEMRKKVKDEVGPKMTVDQYVSLLSSSILLSALNDVLTSGSSKKASVDGLPTWEGNPGVLRIPEISLDPLTITVNTGVGEREVTMTDEFIVTDKTKLTVGTKMTDEAMVTDETKMTDNTTVTDEAMLTDDTDPQIDARPSTNQSQATKSDGQTSLKSSAKFLGRELEFTGEETADATREKCSSGDFRYRTFSSSAPSTREYFDRKRLVHLGPMQHLLRTGSVQRPLRLGSLPVSLQKLAKNSKFWPAEPPSGKFFHQPKKQELATNFKEQLDTIWKWFDQWESHERTALTREVIKVCSPDVLDAFCAYVQQRLKDSRDINHLPDKLLLYVLSFLGPADLLQVSRVCRRWRYLCAMDDLWTLKCLELGEREGVANIPNLVLSARRGAVDIDWMLAYSELKKLIRDLKETFGQNRMEGSSYPAKLERKKSRKMIFAGKSEQVPRTESQNLKRNKKGSVRIKMKDKDEPKRATKFSATVSYSGDSVSSGDEDMMLDTGHSVDQPQWSPTVPQQSQSTDVTGVGKLGGEQAQGGDAEQGDVARTNGETPQSVVTSSGEPQASRLSHQSKGRSSRIRGSHSKSSTLMDNKIQKIKPAGNGQQKTDPGEAVLDMRTDLVQSHDLLGKLVSRSNLKWREAEAESDLPAVYAGHIVAIKTMRKLEGHMSAVVCLWFDVRRIVTCGLDRTIRLWDVRSGRSLHKFLGHLGGVRCVQFDNDILATGSWDSLIMIWDMKHLTNITILHGHRDSVTCLEFNSDFLVSGSKDGTVRVWYRPTFYCARVINLSAPLVSFVLVQHDIITSTADLCTQMVDVATGDLKLKFESPLGEVNSLLVVGNLMIGADAQGRACFWNHLSGELEAAVQVHDAPVNKLAYHNGHFYTASSDSTVKEWDLKTMTCLRVLKGHLGPVRDVKVSDKRIVTCGDDGTTRIYDLDMG